MPTFHKAIQYLLVLLVDCFGYPRRPGKATGGKVSFYHRDTEPKTGTCLLRRTQRNDRYIVQWIIKTFRIVLYPLIVEESI